jgi:hypothetical protein
MSYVPVCWLSVRANSAALADNGNFRRRPHPVGDNQHLPSRSRVGADGNAFAARRGAVNVQETVHRLALAALPV